MYKKKILLSTLSLPFAYYSFNSMDYHKVRAKEKAYEVRKRETNLKQNPVNLNTILNQVSKVNSIKEFNRDWGFKPVEIVGRYDDANTIKVLSNKGGVSGFEIVTPFEFFTGENSTDTATVFIHRGFVDEVKGKNKPLLVNHNSNGYTSVKGVLTMPHRNKEDKENDYLGNKVRSIDLEEFAKLGGTKNLCSNKFMLKVVDLENDNSTAYPLTDNTYSLTNFNVTDVQHSLYKKVYSGLSYLVVLSNMYFWVCL
mmetsp:Transcript_209/g.192  ORF Transcript_209/g.192 Transcript_209/m.192 type:complete len:254 (-) Transcript_209:132-893(-)